MSPRFEGLRATVAATDVASKRLSKLIVVEEPSLFLKRSGQWKSLRTSASISMAIHAIFLLTLSWIVFDLPKPNLLDSILSVVVGDQEPLGADIEIDLPPAPDDPVGEQLAELDGPAVPDQVLVPDEPLLPQEKLEPLASTVFSGAIPVLDPSRVERPAASPPKTAALKSASTSKSASKKGANVAAEEQHVDHFVGRDPATKAALLKRMGGTDASEAAVARGLVWLKNHQLPDGSWNFFHVLSPRCDCTMPGRLANNPNGATAMALMAFLGAGQTHESGDYQPEVQQGIDFLLAHGMPAEKGICFYGQLMGSPTFYTHGLVTIALSEAFAMTHDSRIRPAVTGAVEFLSANQSNDGGWRYFPGQPGDTSVVAWQLMALKSAQFSRITVPQRVLTNVDRFIGGVASARGSQYAYLIDRPPTPSMTAAGLLCRMYLDWKETNPALRAGVRFLDERGPDPEDMYYNYYATQVLHHVGGPEWDRWNNVLREHLIKMQIRDGHATGSWDVSFADRHANAGGRLYITTLALLTLEVYYRHLPLYQRDRIEIPLVTPAANAKPAEAKPAEAKAAGTKPAETKAR